MYFKFRIILIIFLFLGFINPVFLVFAKGQSAEIAIKEDFQPGELLVKLKNNSEIYRFKFDTNSDLQLIISQYENRPEVDYVELNYKYKITAFPNDPDYQKQLYLAAIAAKEGWSKWLLEKEINGFSPVVIAILDTGVDIDHPDLKDNIWINTGEKPFDNIDNDNNGYIDDYNGWDFVLDSADPRPKFDSDYTKAGINHGTIVAGIAAARGHNLEGISGISWDAKIMPLRVLDGQGNGTVYDVYRAINYAINNRADVINMSFVGSDFSQTFKDILKRAADAGLVLVAAAGNTDPNEFGKDLKYNKAYPVCYDSSDDNFIIGVGSIDSSWIKSDFSNFGGGCIDIVAPGENFYSTVVYNPDKPEFNKYYEGHWSGTSMSAPLISGTAAIIKSLKPGISNQEIIKILAEGADDISKFNPEYSDALGSGKLNIYQSIIKSINRELEQQDVAKIKNINLVIGLGFGSFPQVKIFKQDFSEYKSFFAYAPTFKGVINIAVGDVNSDGQPEIITGAGPGGGPHVRIFDQEGMVLNQFFAFDKNLRNGVTIAVGDVTGDGIMEIIAGAGAGSRPEVRIFSASGKLLSSFLAYNEGFLGGVNLAVGDINNDGISEIITGAGPGGGPHVRIFDYKGNVLGQFFPFNQNSRGGVNVAVGNVSGGPDKEIIAAIEKDALPLVRIFRADNFNKINEFFAYEPVDSYGVNLDVTDFNGDGIEEIITGLAIGGKSQVRIFNWQGSVLGQFFAHNENYLGGARISGVKTINKQ